MLRRMTRTRAVAASLPVNIKGAAVNIKGAASLASKVMTYDLSSQMILVFIDFLASQDTV